MDPQISLTTFQRDLSLVERTVPKASTNLSLKKPERQKDLMQTSNERNCWAKRTREPEDFDFEAHGVGSISAALSWLVCVGEERGLLSRTAAGD